MDDEDEIVVACIAVVVCSLGAAMIVAKSKKQKHSTGVKHYQRQTQIWCVALCFQKWKPMIWVDTCSNFTMGVGELCVPWRRFIIDAIYNIFGCKIKLFHSVFSLNYVMISANNKICNENPASTGSLAGSKRVFSTFDLSSTRTNQRTCCINLDSRHVEIDAAGSH